MRDTLYLFLSELETYRRQAGNGVSDILYLDLLIDYMQKAYKTTTERFILLLKYNKIIYDLI